MALKIELKMDEKGYVDMDELTAFLDSLPKVQQAIVHAHIEAKFEDHDPASDHARRRAAWLYA